MTREFSDVFLLMIGEGNVFTHHHLENPDAKTYKRLDGKIFSVDLTKAYQLHGWIPWVDWDWKKPWSLLHEWVWKKSHRVALLIYPDEIVDEKSGLIEPISTFKVSDKDFLELTPRGLEGFIESKIPSNYFKKWTTKGGKVAWWVWVLIAVLIVIMFYVFVVRT